MSTEDASLAIASIEARDAVKRARHADPTLSTEDLLRVAMRTTWRHWLLSGDGAQLRAACAGTMMALGMQSAEAERIGDSHRALAKVSHALVGADMGVACDLSTLQVPDNPVQLLVLWREVSGR
jgi:hypothetical protein